MSVRDADVQALRAPNRAVDRFGSPVTYRLVSLGVMGRYPLSRNAVRSRTCPYAIAMTAHSLGKSAFGGSGISASGMVSSPHFTQTAFQRFQILRQSAHQRPSFVPAN